MVVPDLPQQLTHKKEGSMTQVLTGSAVADRIADLMSLDTSDTLFAKAIERVSFGDAGDYTLVTTTVNGVTLSVHLHSVTYFVFIDGALIEAGALGSEFSESLSLEVNITNAVRVALRSFYTIGNN
jgi:hypothetical protein